MNDIVNPSISIVMAVYNEESNIRCSIESILKQTILDWELIIVNDCSNDNTVEIIKIYQKSDPRIILLHNDENMGLAYSLNKAINESRGKYIARMDADDISEQNRLALQFKYMEENLYVDVLGGSAILFVDREEANRTVVMPRTHDECIRYIPKSTPFFHSSVMIRKSYFEEVGLYNEKLTKAQDYELWDRGRNIGIYENLPDVLIKYKVTLKKDYKLLYKEIKVRTLCALRNRFLMQSIYYSILMLVNNYVVSKNRNN